MLFLLCLDSISMYHDRFLARPCRLLSGTADPPRRPSPRREGGWAAPAEDQKSRRQGRARKRKAAHACVDLGV